MHHSRLGERTFQLHAVTVTRSVMLASEARRDDACVRHVHRSMLRLQPHAATVVHLLDLMIKITPH